jgi:hypothetical protein
MQWLQDSNQSNVDNPNNVTCEASRHFRKNEKEYQKTKIDELEINSKINNIIDLNRGVNDFRWVPTLDVI